jgi:hypothetical protein
MTHEEPQPNPDPTADPRWLEAHEAAALESAANAYTHPEAQAFKERVGDFFATQDIAKVERDKIITGKTAAALAAVAATGAAVIGFKYGLIPGAKISPHEDQLPVEIDTVRVLGDALVVGAALSASRIRPRHRNRAQKPNKKS